MKRKVSRVLSFSLSALLCLQSVVQPVLAEEPAAVSEVVQEQAIADSEYEAMTPAEVMDTSAEAEKRREADSVLTDPGSPDSAVTESESRDSETEDEEAEHVVEAEEAASSSADAPV